MPRPPKKTITERGWRNLPEVADAFGVTTATVRDWVKEGKLAAENVNGYYRISNEEFRRYANLRYGDPQLVDLPEE
jgi:excisionase family DNA binding protein